MIPAKHIVALQQAREGVAVGDTPMSERPICAWLAASAIAGCVITYAVASLHEAPVKKEVSEQVVKAIQTTLPRMMK